MTTITISEANKDIRSIIKKSIIECEEVTIATDDGTVVIVPEGTWNEMTATLDLLKDKVSLVALLEGHSVRDRGEIPDIVINEELKYWLEREGATFDFLNEDEDIYVVEDIIK